MADRTQRTPKVRGSAHPWGLSDQRLKFVLAYLASGNATQAAIEAGYSPKGAGQTGHNLLKSPPIATEITRRRAAVAERAQISVETLVAEAAKIAQAPVEIAMVGPADKMRAIDVLLKFLTRGEQAAANHTTVNVQVNVDARKQVLGNLTLPTVEAAD